MYMRLGQDSIYHAFVTPALAGMRNYHRNKTRLSYSVHSGLSDQFLLDPMAMGYILFQPV